MFDETDDGRGFSRSGPGKHKSGSEIHAYGTELMVVKIHTLYGIHDGTKFRKKALDELLVMFIDLPVKGSDSVEIPSAGIRVPIIGKAQTSEKGPHVLLGESLDLALRIDDALDVGMFDEAIVMEEGIDLGHR